MTEEPEVNFGQRRRYCATTLEPVCHFDLFRNASLFDCTSHPPNRCAILLFLQSPRGRHRPNLVTSCICYSTKSLLADLFASCHLAPHPHSTSPFSYIVDIITVLHDEYTPKILLGRAGKGMASIDKYLPSLLRHGSLIRTFLRLLFDGLGFCTALT